MKIKLISFLLVFALCFVFFTLPGYANIYSDVAEESIYYDAINRLTVLEIMGGDGTGKFHPSAYLSRAEFAKIATAALGLTKEASAESHVSMFNDVPFGHWATGYINLVSKKGYINGFGDGNFKPDEQITYAQIITVVLNMLGYSSENLGGIWPYNFIEKAKALDITAGLAYHPNDPVTREVAALIVDRTLNTKVRSETANQSASTLLVQSGLAVVQECVIIATPNTDAGVSYGKIKTNTGEYTNTLYDFDPYIAHKVELILDEDQEVIGFLPGKQITQKVLVESITGNDIRILNSSGNLLSQEISVITIPDALTVYYHGEQGTFAENKDNIDLGSTLVLSGSVPESFDYLVLFDPDLEGPEIVTKSIDDSVEYIGNIHIGNEDNLQVIRNGKRVSISDIKPYDVVYKLKNSPDHIIRLFAYDNKITGTYDEAYPSKAFVNKIIVSGQEVEIETQRAASKLDESEGAYKLDERITVLTGKDGKAVDVVDLNNWDMSNFAVVVNTGEGISEDEETKGQREYFVKLFKTDGTIQEYRADKDYSWYKGRLVTFDFKNSNLVLESVKYNKVSGAFNKGHRTLGDRWMAKDIIIFDLVSNPDNADAVVNLIKLSDLYINKLREDDVIHAEIANDFGDIQLLFLNNVSYSSYQYGILTDKNASSRGMNISASYTIDIKGQKSKFNLNVIYSVEAGQPVAVDLQNNTINHMFPLIKINPKDNKIQAIDDERIKIAGKIYRLSPEVQVYKRAITQGDIPISINELTTNKYRNISLYAERAPENGGQIRIIMVQ